MRRLMLAVGFALAACGTPATTNDSGVLDAGLVDAGPGCSSTPTTHLELINACTTAVAIVRTPTLPLLQPDGGVPPLP
jgi:hypothetical protein